MSNMTQRANNPPSPDLSLTSDQQALLLTALSSNRPTTMTPNANGLTRNSGTVNFGPGYLTQDLTKDPLRMDTTSSDANVTIKTSPGSENSNLDQSPFLDHDLDEEHFDWDNDGAVLFGNLADAFNEDEGDLHEKRKNTEDERDGEQTGNKRREGEDKSAKKPGRKPLTGEPTTKRKAQNRAAQRAFRERKERHLKDLETKVEDLEKASEATNHENGRLRAQVERLNVELKEYRKRLSLNGTGGGRTPPSAASFSQSRSLANNPYDIQFVFPKFGDLPGSNFMSNGSLTKVGLPSHPVQQPSDSVIPGVLRVQPSDSMNASSSVIPNGSFQVGSPESLIYPSPTNTANEFENLKGLFSPSILETVSRSNSSDYMTSQSPRKTSYPENQNSQTGLPRGSSILSNASPSVSSISNNGLDSSCGTTPEPFVDSPDHRKGSEAELKKMRQESTDLNQPGASFTFTNSPIYDVNGIDWMAQQNGGQFDPVLFGGYRDPQENILNYEASFFNDAFNDRDFTTPFYTGEPLSPLAKVGSMKDIEERPNGIEDGVTPSNTFSDPLSFKRPLNPMTESEKPQAKAFDLDGLCSEFRAKAKCSNGGMAMGQTNGNYNPCPDQSSDYKPAFDSFA